MDMVLKWVGSTKIYLRIRHPFPSQLIRASAFRLNVEKWKFIFISYIQWVFGFGSHSVPLALRQVPLNGLISSK